MKDDKFAKLFKYMEKRFDTLDNRWTRKQTRLTRIKSSTNSMRFVACLMPIKLNEPLRIPNLIAMKTGLLNTTFASKGLKTKQPSCIRPFGARRRWLVA